MTDNQNTPVNAAADAPAADVNKLMAERKQKLAGIH